MTEKIQYIAREGRAEYAVVPIDEWNRIIALAEDAEDLRAADEAVRELRAGNDETVPLEVVEQLIPPYSPPFRREAEHCHIPKLKEEL